MLKLATTDEGVILPVKAKAGARTNGLQGIHDGALRVAVTQAPERGKANRVIVDVLAKGLSLRASQVKLIAGETSPQKRFLICGIDADELSRRIAAATSDKMGKPADS